MEPVKVLLCLLPNDLSCISLLQKSALESIQAKKCIRKAYEQTSLLVDNGIFLRLHIKH